MKTKNDFILQNVGGENILVPIGARVMDMNGLVTLNTTGRWIWEHLAADRKVEDIVVSVTNQFEVDTERARCDVQEFLSEITRLGLVNQ